MTNTEGSGPIVLSGISIAEDESQLVVVFDPASTVSETSQLPLPDLQSRFDGAFAITLVPPEELSEPT